MQGKSYRRNRLREDFEAKTHKKANDNLAEYADWLELRFIQDPKEQLVSNMEDSLKRASDAINEARFHVRRVFNEE